MPNTFRYDVFLSHSAKDKALVRPLAERLRADGLRVWPRPPQPPGEGGFDDWVLKPGDSIPARIEEGLEHSRVLVCPAEASERRRMLCMSAHAFGSDWGQFEAGTFRFRDPLNRECRFIPLRLDDAPSKDFVRHALFIPWRWEHRVRSRDIPRMANRATLCWRERNIRTVELATPPR